MYYYKCAYMSLVLVNIFYFFKTLLFYMFLLYYITKMYYYTCAYMSLVSHKATSAYYYYNITHVATSGNGGVG